MTTLRVRRAAEEDAKLIASFVASESDLYQVAPSESYPLTESVVRHWLEERSSGYVLTDGDDIVAYGELNPDTARSKSFWIGHLVVDPKRRGRQHGRSLVHGLCRVAREHHRAREVWISAFDDNSAALRCYRSAGFRARQRRRVQGRALVDLRRRVDDDRRVFTPLGVAIYAACAAPLTLSILPGPVRSAISVEQNAWGAAAFLLVAVVLCIAAALATIPLLPRRSERGVMRLLRPVLHATATGILAGLLWGVGYALLNGLSQVSFAGILSLSPQYGAGWGVLSSFLSHFLMTRS